MRISRLRLEALRHFREPLEIDGLQEGVNLFVGPNGAGKSTIVRAIRAAFFERFGSSSVSDLLPWDEPGAAPSVEVDFASGGHRYRLRKRFLGRKRCSLEVDGARLENAEAEARLADLMGFQYAGKGASKPEHWGVPGLLWIQQGCGQDLREAVDHATGHLRRALDESLGEVASTGGDEVHEQVRAERDKLLTRTGQPTGELRQAAAMEAAEGDRLAALAAQLAVYRDQVDRFGLLAAQVRAGNREQPWKRLQSEARAAQERLDGIRKLSDALEADRQLLSQMGAQLRLLGQQQASFADQGRQLEQRRLAAGAAAARLADAGQDLHPRRRQLEAAQREHDQAQAALVAAERKQQSRHLLERIAELQIRHVRLEREIDQAREITARLNRHRHEIAARCIGSEHLDSLRRNEGAIQAARIRLEAVATRLSYQLEPGKAVECDGAAFEGTGQSQLVKRTVLRIPQVGTLTIEPGGGHDVAELAAVRNGLESAQAALLETLGVQSLPAAEQRLSQRQAAERDLQVEQARLDQLAPAGPDALVAELAAVAGELADVRDRMAQLGGAGQDDPPAARTGVEEARREGAQAAERLRRAQAAEQDARAALASAASAATHADRELGVLQTDLQAGDHLRRVAQNQDELHSVRLRFGLLEARIAATARSIEAARPQVLEQDAERLDRSAQQALAAHEHRRLELVGLQSLLDAGGAGGIEEQLAESRGTLERLRRRHLELWRRARALDLLAEALESKREALMKRLQAPLLKHLNHYLQLLMPGASVTLDEALRPAGLSMPAVPAGARVSGSGYDDLSFGTREQIGLISRLAYADLLKEADRPTLIILDDCLVNTDTARMSQMKRILFDAATRHQILLFSCHPERWQDLGTAARDVVSLKNAQHPSPAGRMELLPDVATRHAAV